MILVDFDMLAHRCYRAMDHLLSSTQQPTGMEYGVCRNLKTLAGRITEKKIPIVLCLESIGQQRPSWYKAHRKKLEPSFYTRKDLLLKQLKQVYRWAQVKGCEADQVMYTLSLEKQLTYILSNDKDLFQAISPSTVLVRSFESKLFYWTEETLFEKEKVWPWQYAFLKTIRGDASDNIKGIPKIRKALAAEIARYAWNRYAKQGMEGSQALHRALMEHLDRGTKKSKERILTFCKEALQVNYDLISLDKKISATIQEPGGASIQSYLDFLEIRSLTFEEETEF